MTTKNLIYGSGGGGGKSGGGSSSPTESPDSLQSRQKARIIEVLSEGELDAVLVNGLKSVYLNDVPIQNADNSYNFENVTLITASGTPLQDYIPGFSDSESEHSLNVNVQFATPYVFQIPNRVSSGADAVRVTLGIPGLTSVTDAGDITGTSVDVKIEVQNNGGGFVTKVTDTISGKTSSRYQRNYRIQLPQNETGPWDVKVTRLTADSGSAKLINATYLDSYTIISETKMRYTNSAIVGLEIDAEQFSNIPVRGYHSRGIKIKVPVNYDPTTRVYTGLWNGTFKTVYSNNPAWVLYDLITTERYGLGRYIDESLVDKWKLYSIGQYCDEMVPDGYGGTEPRYTCNLFIQERTEAFTLISNIASIAHAAAYGSGGGIAFVQDSPRDPIALFTPANVINGKFEYTGASIKAQHNVILVAWNDPADQYRQKIEYVEDADLISRYGIVQKEVVAMGCTSRGQANRFGKAILFAEKFESEGIAFSASLDSYKVYPGAVFNVADPTRSQIRNGGRLISSTNNSIEIDSPITIAPGVVHTLKVVMPDGSVCSRIVSSVGDNITTINVSEDFSYLVNGLPTVSSPVYMAMWILESSDKVTESWVCLSAEEDEKSGNISIVGMSYRPEKYDLIDASNPLPAIPEYNPYLASPMPTNIFVGAYLNALGGIDVVCSWESAPKTRYTRVAWRKDDDNFEIAPTVYSNSYTIRGASIGTYTFILSTINAAGVASPAASATYTVSSLAILPDVTNLQLSQPFIDKFAAFIWDSIPTADSYHIQILVSSDVVRDIIVTDSWYNYDYAESLADNGGTPVRAFQIRVKGKFGTLESGNWVTLDATNDAPVEPSLSIVASIGGFSLSAPLPSDSDYAGMIVWASTTSGFTPSDANKVYDGVANSIVLTGFTAAIPLYVKAAFYDVFGKTGLNISSQFSITPLSNVADIPVVSSLPTSGPLFVEGKVVYLTTDDKLYRHNGTAWVTWVDGSDLLASSVTAGKISVIELSALSADMGSITAGDITLDSSGFISGGATGYLASTGFWMGYHSGAYKFHIGNPAGDRIVWTGSALDIKGTLNAVNGTFGALSVASGGNIKMGQTAYNTGIGFWLGDSGGTPKFSIGDPSGNHMRFDGTNFIFRGDIPKYFTSPSAPGGGVNVASAPNPSHLTVTNGVARSPVKVKEIKWHAHGSIEVYVYYEANIGTAITARTAQLTGHLYKNGVLMHSFPAIGSPGFVLGPANYSYSGYYNIPATVDDLIQFYLSCDNSQSGSAIFSYTAAFFDINVSNDRNEAVTTLDGVTV